MDARIIRALVVVGAFWSLGASARTKHFIVDAPTQQLVQQVAQAAEQYRHDLAMEWLGKPLPPWADICPIRVQPHRLASGETSFEFPVGGGHPRNWRMMVAGTPERILDSVLPHEILHTVFATHFQNPLPRWADEGACTTVEHSAERKKHDRMLIQFLTGEDGIPFNKMFKMREYPRKILPLYSQGYSVAQYLIAQGGKRKFVNYIGHGMKTDDWADATHRYYDFDNLSDLQVQWVAWVGAGQPAIGTRPPAALAVTPVSATTKASGAASVQPSSLATSQQQNYLGARTAQAPEPQQTQQMSSAAPPRQFAPPQNARPAAGGDDGWFARTAREARTQIQASRRTTQSPPAAPQPTPESQPDRRTVIQWSGSGSRIRR